MGILLFFCLIGRLVPAPLGIPTSGRCLGFAVIGGTHSVVIAADCSVMFSYDGHFLLESTTRQPLCPSNIISGSAAVLLATCTHGLTYAYAERGGSRICTKSSPNLCLSATGYSPGSVLTFVDGSVALFTSIYKGMPITHTHMHILRVSCQKRPTCHSYARHMGPFWQDTLDICTYIYDNAM